MEYAAPLPDFARVALSGAFQLAGRQCTIDISPIQRFPDYGPYFHVVHLRVLVDSQPLTLFDVNPSLPDGRCYQLWAGLCAALQDTTSATYGLTPDESGEPNPRLGCWGPRPDLLPLGESDCFTALVLGLAIDTRAATRRPSSAVLAQQLSAAVLRALRGWERAAATP
jgi:hypothetical protein